MKKVFVRGLLTVAPIAITIAVIVWLFDIIEGVFKSIIIEFGGGWFYFPGLGLLIALVVIFFIGVIINNWIIQKLYALFEKLLHKMPLVKTLYRSIVDLMSFFKGDSKATHGPVVMVEYADTKMLGIVARETFDDLPEGVGKEGEVAVFIPMSYQIGGVTVIVPKSKVHKIDMTIEQGMRFAATAAMPGNQKSDDAKIENQKESENKNDQENM